MEMTMASSLYLVMILASNKTIGSRKVQILFLLQTSNFHEKLITLQVKLKVAPVSFFESEFRFCFLFILKEYTFSFLSLYLNF